MNLSEIHELADAVLLVWYPGEEGGNAVADILFGKASPSGKLPITFPKSFDQLPPYEEYGMKGRTYRYMEQEPMYPFGFGLSYTTFRYSDLKLSATTVKKKQPVEAGVTVTNSGTMESEEVVQLYITDVDSSGQSPLFTLLGVKRIRLKPGESTKVNFTIAPAMMEQINVKGESVLEPGKFKISIGGSLPGTRSAALGASDGVNATFTVK
jgi:beta-glucosidase